MPCELALALAAGACYEHVAVAFGVNVAFEEEDGDPSDKEDIEKLDIPIHAFDLVIADECHRGYTAAEISKWREVLDYFDAVKIGLTATPASNTTAYFNDIVFRYDYQKAVLDGYLVDYEPVAIKSKVKINGIFLKENELVGIVGERGREKLGKIEDERGYEATKVEREVTKKLEVESIVYELAKPGEDKPDIMTKDFDIEIETGLKRDLRKLEQKLVKATKITYIS